MWLPEMLQALLDCPAYDRGQRPPSDSRGVYLFSGSDEHLYVGRTGITTRTRRAGTEPTTSFRRRFDQHTQRASPPWSAPFAMYLARDEAVTQGVEIPPSGWWKNRFNHSAFNDIFSATKQRVGDQLEFRVVAFDDDERGIRSLVAEAYAAAILRTQYNDFSPS